MRLISLEGGRNFRDLGGYRAADGRSVKWRVLFRSGSMCDLTSDDCATLRTIGIRTIIDLRSTNERRREPLAQAAGFAPSVFAADYVMETSALGRAMPTSEMVPEQARLAFERAYTSIPYQFAKQYREMFAQLLAGNVPLIVNCSGGKDRTGVVCALLLTALGVPRETVVEDYLFSRRSTALTEVDAAALKNHPRWGRFSAEVMEILRGVEPRLLDAAFDAIERRSGGLEGYFRDELDLSPANLHRLQSLYLE